MSCAKFGRLVMFLYTVTMTELTTMAHDNVLDQQEIVNRYVQVDNSNVNVCIKEVTIQNSERYSIFLCAMDDFQKSYAFYTAVSCEFAGWTMNRIFNFVKQSPIFYQKNFEYHRVYKKLFQSRFKDSVRSLSKIDERLRRFISVMHSFAIKNAHVTYYNDVSVFSAFISLRFKMHLVKFYGQKNYVSGFNKSDSFILQSILEDMNVIQRFLAMNCLDQPSHHRNSSFTGYWISEIDEVLVGLDTIDSLLVNIRPFNLETDHPPCFVSQTILDRFVSLSSNDRFSCDVIRSSVYVTKTKKISIKTILEKLSSSCDTELLYLYQESVVSAIMKLMYSKITEISKHYQWLNASNMIYMIETIYLEISENSEYFPDLMVEGFRLFKSIIVLKGNINELQEHKAYQYLLSRIEISEFKPPLDKVNTVILAERMPEKKCEKSTCTNKLEQLLLVRVHSTFENSCNISSDQKSIKNIDEGCHENSSEECKEFSHKETFHQDSSDNEDSDDENSDEECSDVSEEESSYEDDFDDENSDDESSDDESSDDESSDDESSDDESSDDEEISNYDSFDEDNSDDDYQDAYDVEFEKRFDYVSEEKYMQNVMKKILTNLDDFKCLHQSVKFQHTEHDKYYRNKFIKFLEFNLPAQNIDNDNQTDKICSFVLSIHSTCYQAVMIINKMIDNKSNDLNQILLDRLIKTVNSIRDYVFTVIINKQFINYFKANNLSFYKMALNVAIIILNSQKFLSKNGENVYRLERIINVVMTELNIFGTKHCDQSKFNFLLHNNMNFMYTGNGDIIEKCIITLFKNIDKNYDTENSNVKMINEVQHLNIQYLYDTYVIKSKVFSLYGNNVKFFWKGKKMSTKEVYEDMIFLNLNPYDLFLLYDIYFKFYIAVIYYEIRVILEINNYSIIKKGFSQLNNILSEFKLQYFPQKLHYLIKEIHIILETPLKKYNVVNQDEEMLDFLSISKKRIDHNFFNYGIQFKKHSISTTLKQGIMYINVFHAAKEVFKVINHELLDHVSCFNDLFSKLQDSIPNDDFFEEN